MSEETTPQVPPAPTEPMIPKYRFDELNQKLKLAEARITELEGQVKEGEAKAKRVEELERELADTKASYEKEKSDARRMEAVRAGLGEGVIDQDVVIKLLDMEKIQLGEDGKVTGLEEQVKELRTSKPYLFSTPPAPVKPSGSTPTPTQKTYAQQLAEKKTKQQKVVSQSQNYFG